MNILRVGLLIIAFLQYTRTYFIRSNKVYEEVIKEVSNYYDADSVFIFYSHGNYVNIEDIETSTRLGNLFISLNSHSLRVTVTSIEKFLQKYVHSLQKMLLVFLNDSWDLKIQLMEQLAPAIHMSDPLWLIFLQPETDFNNYFDGLDIPFDCRFMVSQRNTSDNNNSEIITEVYRVWKDKELRYNIFGSWNPITGAKLPKTSLYKRRNSLHGHTLRVSTANWKPLIIISVDKNNKTKVEGGLEQIMDILQESMNFTSTYLITKGFGYPSKNGTWDGSTGDLAYHRADFGLMPFQINRYRLDVIEFTVPISITRSHFFFLKSDTSIKWNAFLMPFHRNIWICILFIILIMGTLINLITTFYWKNFPQDIKNEKHLHLLNIFVNVFGAFCSQGIPRSSINSIAIIQFTVHITSIVIYAAYSGLLISSLTVDTTLTHTKSLEEIFNEDSKNIGALQDVGPHLMINSTDDPLLKKIYEKRFLPSNLLPLDNFEALERLCNGSMIFFSTNLFSFNLEKDDCIIRASEPAFQFNNAFGLQRDSPFREFFNKQITYLRDNGILSKLLENYGRTKLLKETNSYESVEINYVLPLFIFLGMSYFISFLFLCYEHYHYTKKQRI